MPDMKDFRDACGLAETYGDIAVYLPPARVSDKAAGREGVTMTRSFGDVYAGEIPLAAFAARKPEIGAFLSPSVECGDYLLSARASAGVLDRDRTRGRPLPAALRDALRLVADGAVAP